MHKHLRECGCVNVIDYVYFRRCYQLFRGEKYNLPACSDVYFMLENQDMIEKAFSVMESERAKATFLKLLEFRMLTDRVDIPISPEKGMYFEYDFSKEKMTKYLLIVALVVVAVFLSFWKLIIIALKHIMGLSQIPPILINWKNLFLVYQRAIGEK